MMNINKIATVLTTMALGLTMASAQVTGEEQVFSKGLVFMNNTDGTPSNTTTTTTTTGATPELWAVLVADTEDESIGDDDRLDNQNINAELNSIAKALGMKTHITNIKGKSCYDKKAIANAITSIKPGKNDIAIFWFNGHGFRWSNQTDSYSNIFLGYKSDETIRYMSSSDIYRAMMAKGARLTLVFTDCCNSKVDERAPRQTGSSVFSKATQVSTARLRDLFFNQEGGTLATAASPGEYAYSFTDEGSAFTLGLISAIRSEAASTNKKEVSWSSVVDNAIRSAKKKTTEAGCDNTQHGLRYVNVHKVK